MTDGGDDTVYFLCDGLGSTTGLTDEAGDEIASYEYDVFGAVRAHTGASTEFTYTGEQNDPTALEYLRARYYDSESGRFLSRDPLGLPQAYQYAANNPIMLTDPLGLCPLVIGCDIGETIGNCLGHPIRCAGNARECVANPLECLLDATYRVRTYGTRFIEDWAFALSGGDVINKEGGVRALTNCSGLCSALIGSVNTSAITIGRTIFTTGTFEGTAGRRLLGHELRHVGQYELLGDLFLPIYFGPAKLVALLACSATRDLSARCIHDRNILEYLADR